MAQYLISDFHLDYENIIGYCDRPFDTIEEMNKILVENWNSTAVPDDEVIFGGDLTINRTEAAFFEWIDQINGEVVFIVGNHDRNIIKVLDQVHIMQHYQFLLVTMTSTVRAALRTSTKNCDGWAIFDHHHNNHPDSLPFFDPDSRRINLFAELLNYTPVHIVTIIDCIDRNERLAVGPE